MTKKKRKICIFSGKRGGFGAFVPLMKMIEDDNDLELQILLGDMHTSAMFGKTLTEAEEMFPKSKVAYFDMGSGRGDTELIRAENLGSCMKESARILADLKSDIVIVHADRGEHLMVAFAALNLNIPIAHTQGGDVSGNIDDIQRHAITKMAHIHFPESEDAAKRIEKLGEEKWRIHNVGSLYIDRITRKMYTPFDKVVKKYGLSKNKNYFVILFHPDTFITEKNKNYQYMVNIIKAIRATKMPSFVIYPCSDPGYEGVIKVIKEIENDKQFMIYKNIDNLDFLSILKNAKVLIGNSSSALVEAPYLKLPAINIGERQKGRFCEENIVQSAPTTEDILKNIEFVLNDEAFRRRLHNCGYHLGDGNASQKIINILKDLKIDNKLLQKRITY